MKNPNLMESEFTAHLGLDPNDRIIAPHRIMTLRHINDKHQQHCQQ